MKIKNIINKREFFQIVNKCKGNVELISSEGDVLNLKSTLCQYIALTQMFVENKVPEFEIVTSNPDDMEVLREYLIEA